MHIKVRILCFVLVANDNLLKYSFSNFPVYVRFEKVAAMDFLRVQLDTNFRKKWDSSATELKVIDENKNISSDLVYWEMRWPVS